MKNYLEIPYDQGRRIATFTLINRKGVFHCPAKIPLIAVGHLAGRRFDQVVETDDPFISLLNPTIIISADTDDTGTTFQLEFPSSQN